MLRRSARMRSPVQPVKYVCADDVAIVPRPATTKSATIAVQRLRVAARGCRGRSRASPGTAAPARSRWRAGGSRSRAPFAPCTAWSGARASDPPRRRAPRPVARPSAPPRAREVAAGLVDPHAVARSSTRERTPARAGRARRCRGRPRLVARSSSCVPRAAIVPESSTTISSAREIVESRCAMMIVVRPRITSRSPCLICASVVASTDAVASSRIEHARVDDERPRDRDPLALPARERDPALADHRVVPVGQPVDELLRLRELGRALDLLVRRVDDAEGDVLAHGRREEERILRDDADRAPERAERHVAHVDAVELDAALRRVVEAADERGERGLAGARVADQRGRRSRLELEVDAVQNGRPGAYSKRTSR